MFGNYKTAANNHAICGFIAQNIFGKITKQLPITTHISGFLTQSIFSKYKTAANNHT